MITLDAHCDAPSQMLRLRDFSCDNDLAQVDFPKMKRGGVDASFFALYVPASLKAEQALAYTRKLLEVTLQQLSSCRGLARLTLSAPEALENKARGLISVFLGIENATALEPSPSALLEEFYKKGVRYVTLTHSADNFVADSCTGKGTWGGLSTAGRDLVREMNRIGMLVDLAHSSEATMRDVLSLSTKPVAYTHGCCSALCGHRRNISDDILRELSRRGGVACMSVYPSFLSDEFPKILEESGLEDEAERVESEFIQDPASKRKLQAWQQMQLRLNALSRPSVGRVVDHIEHAIEVSGIDHVGLGTDFDGIEFSASGLEDISKLGLVWQEMRSRGYSDAEISKVAGENFLRLL